MALALPIRCAAYCRAFGPVYSRKDALYREKARKRASRELHYKHDAGCNQCAAREICDGFHGDFARLFGTSEATPILEQEVATSPLHYIRHQEKVVEPKDREWALRA